MRKFYLILFLSLLGIVLTILSILQPYHTAEIDTESIPKWHSPYKLFVAGTGIVEANSTNIPIGTPVSGIIKEVYVKIGDHIKKGDPLFKIDDSDLSVRIPLLKAQIEEIRTIMVKYRHIYEIDKNLYTKTPGVISKKRFEISQDNYRHAKSKLGVARAKLLTLKREMARRIVHAPMDGMVMKCKLRPGLFMEASTLIPTQLLLGSDRMNLRVEVDEYDAWRVKPGAMAVGFIRGHPDMNVKLNYEYTEPYMVPKKVLTGLSTERTDTRVLQIVYSFDRPGFPVYFGETMDVFIDATDINKSEHL